MTNFESELIERLRASIDEVLRLRASNDALLAAAKQGNEVNDRMVSGELVAPRPWNA